MAQLFVKNTICVSVLVSVFPTAVGGYDETDAFNDHYFTSGRGHGWFNPPFNALAFPRLGKRAGTNLVKVLLSKKTLG